MSEKEMICIVCPMGCRMTLIKDDNQPDGYRVDGNTCKRGYNYAIEEQTNPKRVIPTTVKIKNGILNRLPVKTNGAVPKELIFECMKVINKVEVEAPIKTGDVVVENILGTGIDVVATRTMERV
jgi:CxxC motif-containing protein